MLKIILLILAGLYSLNPYDVFPDFMVGWGWLDDLIIWILLWRYFVSRKKKYTADPHFEDRGRPDGSNQQRFSNGDPNAQASEPWDPFRVLGVGRDASAEEIKRAYRELASRYHPDKLEHLGDEFKVLAEVRFKEIQRAYEELTAKRA